MNSIIRFGAARSAPLWAILTAAAVPGSLPAADGDCVATVRKVSRQVAERPERVLVIVEDTLVVSDACACEVVKAAIVAASASAKLAAQIVFVAVSAAPTKAVLIGECAKAASPDAAAEIDVAMRKALGPDASRSVAAASSSESAPAAPDSPPAGKAPIAETKNPAPTPPPKEADFGLSPVAIGGVYLVYPGSGGSPQLVRDKEGRLYFIGPGGRRIPLDPPPPITKRPPRPPGIVIVRPPTPTSSDILPEDVPLDPAPPDPIPVDPPPPDPAA